MNSTQTGELQRERTAEVARNVNGLVRPADRAEGERGERVAMVVSEIEAPGIELAKGGQPRDDHHRGQRATLQPSLHRATKGSHPILYSSFHARSLASLARAAASAKAMKAAKYTTSRVSMTPRCIDL